MPGTLDGRVPSKYFYFNIPCHSPFSSHCLLPPRRQHSEHYRHRPRRDLLQLGFAKCQHQLANTSLLKRTTK